MASEEKRPLKVFLCHASGDKPPVRDLYKRLVAEGVDAWLDKERLLPGQDWRLEIPKAVKAADVVVVCLSNKSITKEGYVQKEIKFALDSAEEKPEGTIFLIPARLEECPVPERLSRWQWVDLYEENGFFQLLRSLKLRADAVGATVEPTSYVDSDKETESRLEGLYTEGLAAFYTEDWDRACQRFQSILSERPSHKNATEKLAEAEQQRILSRLYEQASAAIRGEEWEPAVKILEELSQKSVEYKDVTQLLRNARKQKQLRELYAEAGKLHAAQKWQAVVKVFEQIAAVESNYPDPQGFLPSAQKGVAEQQRLAELNDQYRRGLREMDLGNWVEARRLLEWVHKSQTGFLETEKLLRKVENEILKEEEKRRQNDQVNTLYEQAHGLLRSKKWRKALDKIEEIEKLDAHFEDKDGIAPKARAELEHEEKDAQKQNQLAAKYAEAVRLLKEEKYQEALNKWQEVRTIDPKYPDRQWVQRTARKKMAEVVKPVQVKPRFVMSKPLWIGIVGLLVVGTVITGVILSDKGGQGVLPVSTKASAIADVSSPASQQPQPPTLFPTTSGYADPTMYDDFDESTYEGSYNKKLWNVSANSTNFAIAQSDGRISIQIYDRAAGAGLDSVPVDFPVSQIFSEARVFLDPGTIDKESILGVGFGVGPNHASCVIVGLEGNKQEFECSAESFGQPIGSKVTLNEISSSWHTVRIEYEPEGERFTYFIDGTHVGSIATPVDAISPQTTNVSIYTHLGINNNGPSKAPVGYVDYVRMGAIEDDPAILFHDNFDALAFEGHFDPDKWVLTDPANKVNGRIYQEGGALVFTQKDRGFQGLETKNSFGFVDNKPIYIETDLKFITGTLDDFLVLSIDLNDLRTRCSLHGMSGGWSVDCYQMVGLAANPIFSHSVEMNQWHRLRVEIDPQKTTLRFIIDGKLFRTYEIGQDSSSSRIKFLIESGLSQSSFQELSPLVGYIDNVRVGLVEK